MAFQMINADKRLVLYGGHGISGVVNEGCVIHDQGIVHSWVSGTDEDQVAAADQLWDERLSTAQAERLMIGAGTRRSKRKQSIDKIAAAVILQSFLDANPR